MEINLYWIVFLFCRNMVVSHMKRCIFIHIPKTGGTSVEQFIRDHDKNDIQYLGVRNNRSMHHMTASQLKIELPLTQYNTYYRFSIVRNPYDRLLSEYYWSPVIGYKKGHTKTEFLKHVIYIVRHQLYYTNIYFDHFIPQYKFVYDQKKLQVHHLFKFEDMEWIKKYLSKKLNISSEFPCFNRTETEKEEWTDDERKIIYKLYQEDFKRFGYAQ